MSHIRISRRRNGGIRVQQADSFILLNRDEAVQIAADIQRATEKDSPVAPWRGGAETTKIGDLQAPR
jgi:hypothetical protein